MLCRIHKSIYKNVQKITFLPKEKTATTYRVAAFDISLFTGFGMLLFFINLRLMEFRVRYLVLFRLFSVIDSFECFWMGSIHKSIQLMLELLKATILVEHFSYHLLMTFLMMLSVIFLSMLTILHSVLSVIRHLICGNN